LGLQEQ